MSERQNILAGLSPAKRVLLAARNPLSFAQQRLPADFARIPRFTYREELWHQIFARFIPSLLGLLALAFFCGLVGLRALRRFSSVG